jgi:protease I
MSLKDKKVAILIAPRGTEDSEFSQTKATLEYADATIIVLGIEKGDAETFKHDLDPVNTYPIDALVDDVSSYDFDALVIPGGTVGADKLRGNKKTIELVKTMATQGKLIAAICHGPWVLIEADLAKGRTLTSFITLKTDIVNAGGTWIDKSVVEDNGVITSRKPNDIPAFTEAIIKALS